MDNLSLSSYSAVMAGQMEAWANELERIKRSVNQTTVYGESDFLALDDIVCRMRQSVETWTAINHAEGQA